MDNFDDLKALWQGHTPAPGPSARDLAREIRRHSRRHLRIYIVKGLLVVCLARLILGMAGDSSLAAAGVLAVLGGALVIIAVEWVAHLGIDVAVPSTGFALAALQKLRRLERPGRIHYGVLLFAILPGLNLAEAPLLQGLEPGWRIAAHAGLSLFMLAAAWAGFRVRARRFERQTRPLIERLEAFARWERDTAKE